MLQLTQKGKEVYGDVSLRIEKGKLYVRYVKVISDVLEEIGSYSIASNPLELKALVDLGLIEIN